MPLLKDYLGSLVSGINQARAMADVESAKIAEAYAANSILKNFSVPRFKASNIELDIPIAIDELNEVEEKNYQPIDNKSFNSFAYNVFKDVLKVDSFGRKQSDLLRKRIAADTDVLEKDLKAKEDIQKSLNKYATGLTRFFVASTNSDNKEIQRKLIAQLQESLISKIQAPKKTIDMDNTKVLVQSHQLKEIPPENIVRIKMTLVEEGMEWQTIERDNGEVETKLLPE
ncbi:hypothetical protein PK35_15065 [Tamlana nanhaiensis]|uniref:Uncharacterized protein n=1 Tax=Neotamlana nanhaiensis TaxID=1382798 RepID=A0A0D7VX22_9FLAO|nr:hypothetical protein [Tamlana nanhaiensis]KJD31425.1 hypothetical protein PK35_15065 [Tamlana nanhaiensis]